MYVCTYKWSGYFGKKIRLGISYDGQSSLLAKILKNLIESNVIFLNEMDKLIPVDGDDIFFQIRFKVDERKLRLKKLVPQIISNH